ncbi:MAG: hypothetical protein AAF907_17695, partial [Planctomycetota bacterium]
AATRSTLAKIDGKLERRLQALRRGLETGPGDASRVGTGAAGPMRMKLEMLERLPSYLYGLGPGADGTVGTADDPLPLSEADDVRRRVRNGGAALAPFDDADFPNDPTASSEALFLFLTQGETYGIADTDIDAFKESELADSDGDGLREIVDGWGNPIRFYRWPTRVIRPAVPSPYTGVVPETTASTQDADGRWPDQTYGSGGDGEFGAAAAVLFGSALPSAEFDRNGNALTDLPADPFLPTLGSRLRSDPDDRFAQIHFEFRPIFFRALSAPNDLNAVGQDFERLFHTPSTFYTPIAVSAGPDEELGLYEPQDRDNFGHLAQPREPVAILDNLTTAQTNF